MIRDVRAEPRSASRPVHRARSPPQSVLDLTAGFLLPLLPHFPVPYTQSLTQSQLYLPRAYQSKWSLASRTPCPVSPLAPAAPARRGRLLTFDLNSRRSRWASLGRAGGWSQGEHPQVMTTRVRALDGETR